MSTFVSNLLLNPVLRQARRFSRSSHTGDNVDSVTNQQLPSDTLSTSTHSSLPSPTTDSALSNNGSSAENVSGRTLMSYSVAERIEVEEGLPTHEESGPRRTDVDGRSTAVSLRLASLRSDVGTSDDEMSDNPSFGIPGRFQATSPMSSTLNVSPSARLTPDEGLTRMTTQDSGQSTSLNRHRTSSLPEDDGMGELRKQIVRIQAMDVGSETKALMMHEVLTQDYNKSQNSLHAKVTRPRSPSSMASQETPTTPGSLRAFGFLLGNSDSVSQSSSLSSNNGFKLSPEDLRPTFAPLLPPVSKDDGEESDAQDRSNDSEVSSIPQLGCKHYRRKVKLQCSTCDRWYTCRFCHDEVEDHLLNRRETKNMLCMLCGYAQHAGEVCMNCGVDSAWYYCSVCHLWDDDTSKSIYHCDDCGICRVGRGLGKDYMHCKVICEFFIMDIVMLMNV